jgi:peptidoglycan/xylan/chitin deacetylase (PgdA/CDA1 family)
MSRYFIKTPWLVKRLFSNYTWDAPAAGNAVYLTFDDGPHPTITPWVLDQLALAGAKASFFCIGKNVVQHQDIMARISTEGHAIGNHTHNHLNGWKTDTGTYLENIREASKHIHTSLFRPPYGRIRRAQARAIPRALDDLQAQVVMWDVLSADFDRNITPEQCMANVLLHTEPGSIIVFHDSEKAWPNLEKTLPIVLEEFKKRGYEMRALATG